MGFVQKESQKEGVLIMANGKTKTIITAALLAALTTVATNIKKPPRPKQASILVGDGLGLLGGFRLGRGVVAIAAGVGSMLADLFGGYMAWVPGTFAIKALTALAGGWLYHHMAGRDKLHVPVRVALSGIPAEVIMVAGYYGYELGMQTLAGSSVQAAGMAVLAGVPFNVVQGLAGVIVCAVLLPVLARASGEMGARIRA